MDWIVDEVLDLALNGAADLAESVIGRQLERRQTGKKRSGETKTAKIRKGEKTMSIKSLIINPGSTSTKIGVFEDETLLFEETLRHSTEEIGRYATIVDQKDFRKKIITDLLEEKKFDLRSLDVVVGRGGMLKPIPGGT